MSEEQERKEWVARELARRDGHKWEDVEEYLKKAYYHNADIFIEQHPKPKEVAPVVEEEAAAPEVCPECGGKGFVELEGGTIMVPCSLCGEKAREVMPDALFASVIATPGEPEPKALPEPKKGQYLCGKCLICHYEEKKIGQRHLKYKVEAIDDNKGISGTGPDIEASRSGNTGKSKQPKKPRTRKKAAKKSG